MKSQTQYNLLAALCALIAAALLLADRPEVQGMAFLTLAGTLTGRGRA